MTNQESKDAIAPVLGRVPSGVFILVAASAEGEKTGMLASWVQQASFDPPQVTVAVNNSRYLNEWLSEGAALTLNQIAKGDSVLFRHFGKGFEPNVDAFAGIQTTEGANGLPLLIAAMNSMEGTIVSHMEAGDHRIYLVEINAAKTHHDVNDTEPFVHIRKNGFSY